MKEIYYEPTKYKQLELDLFEDNVRPDRNNYDLLIQVMLELGIPLSIPITELSDSSNLILSENYLIANFDDNLDLNVIESIAKCKPVYAVFKNSSINKDALLSNISQVFTVYSPDTKLKVI